MNTTQEKIVDKALRNEKIIADIEFKILEMIDLQNYGVTQSDIQGIVEVEARKLYWKIRDSINE